MQGDIETVTIKDESDGTNKRFQLYVDGQPRGLITRARNGKVELHWLTAGPSELYEARAWLQGMMELLLIAEQLAEETRRGKKKARS